MYATQLIRRSLALVVALLALCVGLGTTPVSAQEDDIFLPMLWGQASGFRASIPVGGRCAADMHLVNRAAGAPGIAHLDPAGYMDNTSTGPDTYNDA
ncbi:MAG: hypothetical protein KDD84_20485, partial [Caldilineaceae bacterium]|nr:hypothetical protein [Caldilineaceae bacterium]